MTVPHAVRADRRAVACAAATRLIGAGHGDRCRDGARGDRRRRAVRGRPGVPAARSIEACHERDVPAMPGCFSPTEILAAWELGADIVKVFPATSLGPASSRICAGRSRQIKLMPTGGVTRDERRRLDSRRRGGDWRRHRAGRSQGRRGAAIRCHHANARHSSTRFVMRAPVPTVRAQLMAKTVCFGEIMLRLSPPGFERLLQSPRLHATFGGGEANVAVSLAQFGHESHYVTRVPSERRSATRRSRRCAPKACASITCSAAAIGSASISRRPAPASAPRR